MMTTDVQQLVRLARSLPPDKQVELLQGLAQTLTQSVSPPVSPLAQASAGFWTHWSIAEVARQQNTPVRVDIHALTTPGWPNDETAGDVVGYLMDQRRADRDD